MLQTFLINRHQNYQEAVGCDTLIYNYLLPTLEHGCFFLQKNIKQKKKHKCEEGKEGRFVFLEISRRDKG